MELDSIPLAILFLATVIMVMASFEGGYALGNNAQKAGEAEKTESISGVSGAVLSLTAFMLAFTFSMVANRYEVRKELVREDANDIRTAYKRTDLLPDSNDRTKARELVMSYLDQRLAYASKANADPEHMQRVLLASKRIEKQLWDITIRNTESGMNSDYATLLIESLDELAAVQASRVDVGLESRIPLGIWIVLYGLTILGMMSIGYHSGIVKSKHTKATWLLALSFATVISFLISMDRPTGFIEVTQQPLIDLQTWILEGDS